MGSKTSQQTSTSQEVNSVPLIQKSDQKRQRVQRSQNGPRTKKPQRGSGMIFDVIDQWLAPSMARWIANLHNSQKSD